MFRFAIAWIQQLTMRDMGYYLLRLGCWLLTITFVLFVLFSVVELFIGWTGQIRDGSFFETHLVILSVCSVMLYGFGFVTGPWLKRHHKPDPLALD